MATFELVIGLLLACALLTLLARRVAVPYPVLLAVAGAGLALVPGVPVAALDPDLALALFVSPVLLDAAYDASPRDLRDNWVPLVSLVVAAVLLTVAAVAVVARAIVPGMHLLCIWKPLFFKLDAVTYHDVATLEAGKDAFLVNH